MEPKHTDQRRVVVQDTASTPASGVVTSLPNVFTGIQTVLPVKNTEISMPPDGVKVHPPIVPLGDLKIQIPPSAVKFDEGKLDWSLLPIDSVEEILKVLEFGKTKYSAWNWSSGDGFKYTRVFNSTLRHLFAWVRGEDNDPESGLSHIAHAGCNILFILYFIKHKDKYTNNDDRSIK